jgi:3-hydroxyacyl-CoA dehydrogenase
VRTIERVGVLGAGTMGSRIAAHFANAGIPALLLDVVLPNEADRNAAAVRGIQTAASQKPGAFFTEDARALVTPGNFEDDLPALGECDWVIEAVTENLEIKRALLEKVARWRKPGSLISTNTSGIPLAQIAAGFPFTLRRNFLGAHFFNPPRYLHLLEVIPGPDTAAEALDFVCEFADRRLGKGVVRCKDTPNFVGNRIGVFFGTTAQQLMTEGDYTIEEVDALTGPLIGLPRSASFRLVDLIGLDTWRSIAVNQGFPPPEFLTRMVERGWLGEKTKQGFYRRTAAKEILALDWKTLEYHPAEKPRLAEIEAARAVGNLPKRLRMLVSGHGRAGSFLWRLLSELMLYAAGRIPEIAGRVVEVDRAMRWGYAHTLGPFELWDALGVREVAARLEEEGREIPSLVGRMLQRGAASFYRAADAGGEPRTEYFDLAAGRYAVLEPRDGILSLSEIRRARGVLLENAGAALIDLGGGVLCVELRGGFGEPQEEIIRAAITQAAAAVVIAAEGENFSPAADPATIRAAADADLWRAQQTNMAIKYARVPVVVAVSGQTLGAGCEMALHAARIQASAELYMGLTEMAAGLIPARGGTKEMCIRLGAKAALELLGQARVSASAADAQRLGLLRPSDGITMNPERLLADAKAAALALSPGYAPPKPASIPLSGVPADSKLAPVLGGLAEISEEKFLDLERETFLSLCGGVQKAGRPL